MSVPDKEFVCELRFVVVDATKEYSVDDLRNWLRKNVIVDIGVGKFYYGTNADQSAHVSSATFLNTLKQIKSKWDL